MSIHKKIILKFFMKSEVTQIAKTILEKDKVRFFTQLDLRTQTQLHSSSTCGASPKSGQHRIHKQPGERPLLMKLDTRIIPTRTLSVHLTCCYPTETLGALCSSRTSNLPFCLHQFAWWVTRISEYTRNILGAGAVAKASHVGAVSSPSCATSDPVLSNGLERQ